MQPRPWCTWALLSYGDGPPGCIPACQSREPEPVVPPAGPGRRPGPAAPPLSPPLRDEIPAAELSAVMAAHFKGLGCMERYEYGDAVEAFREVRRLAPGWIPGSINLAIALLNDNGGQGRAGQEGRRRGHRRQLRRGARIYWPVCSNVTRRIRHAHFCRGIILEQQGQIAVAHQHFKTVTEIDPNDAAAWYWTASTLPDPEHPSRPAGRRRRRSRWLCTRRRSTSTLIWCRRFTRWH